MKGQIVHQEVSSGRKPGDSHVFLLSCLTFALVSSALNAKLALGVGRHVGDSSRLRFFTQSPQRPSSLGILSAARKE